MLVFVPDAHRSDGERVPAVYAEFLKVCETLRTIIMICRIWEFTVENKKLYMLQCQR